MADSTPKKQQRENLVFSAKKALIIGGTGGIGLALLKMLAERGAEIVIHGGSSKEKLNKAIKTVQDMGGKAEGFLLNIDRAVYAEELQKKYPDIDILVCSFGPFMQGRLERHDLDAWEYMTEMNLIFPGLLVSKYLKRMMDNKWGRILLFGGTNTDHIRGFKTTVPYSAAKTALGVIAKSVALSAGSQGVNCNVICPGLADTEYCTEKQRSYNKKKSPDGEALTTEEIAKIGISMLENPVLNGAIVGVDKGLVL